MTEEIGGLVFDIQRFSIHDGPGIRTLVFLKGCPLRCKWCSNPEGLSWDIDIMSDDSKCIKCGACREICHLDAITVDEEENYVIDRELCDLCGKCAYVCPSGAKEIKGDYKTVEEIVSIAKRDAVFSKSGQGGLTLGGGECIAQPQFVYEILKRCKEEGVDTAIETSGMGNWDWFNKIVDYCDTVFYDLKAIDPEKHKELTGVSNEIILQNLINLDKKIANMKEDKPTLIIRMPLIKGYNAGEKEFTEAAKFIKNNLTQYSYVELLPFHNFGEQKYRKLDMDYEFLGRLNDKLEDHEHLIEIMKSMDIPVEFSEL